MTRKNFIKLTGFTLLAMLAGVSRKVSNFRRLTNKEREAIRQQLSMHYTEVFTSHSRNPFNRNHNVMI